MPTLIVWGRNDRVVPVPAALSYKKRIGDNAELVIFDHCGHVPQIERPVRFNRVLERVPGPRGGRWTDRDQPRPWRTARAARLVW